MYNQNSIPNITGNNIISFSYDKIDVNNVLKQLLNDGENGAMAIFVGTTRGSTNRKKVMKLEYTAYERMAIVQINKICNSTRQKFPEISEIAIQHKLGDCYVGQTGIIICVSSPHRKQALLACHDLIDEIKASAPIWKKEYYNQEDYHWIENPDWHNFKLDSSHHQFRLV